MASIKAQLVKYRVRKDGTYPLVIQVIHCRRKRLVYTPYHLYEDCFDWHRRCVVNRRKHRVSSPEEVNKFLSDMQQTLSRIVETLEEEQGFFSVEDIVSLYRSNQDCSFVFTYFHRLIEELHSTGRTGTSVAYQSALNCLLRFEQGHELLTFDEMTSAWLNRFISYLKRSSLRPNTIHFYVRILRAVYNRAQKDGIFGADLHSPFQHVVLPTAATRKRAINQTTIQQIAAADVRNEKPLELSRDLFLFSFYSRGMPFVDMAYLKYSDLSDGYLRYSRRKTHQPLSVKIVEPLRRLIDKYQNDGQYVLPIFQGGSKSLYEQYRSGLRYYNRSLRVLSAHLKLPVCLSSYVARHSWATMAHGSGVPVSVISAGLGHSSEKTTYAYLAALDPRLLDAANDKIVDSFCLYV
jgi:integrase